RGGMGVVYRAVQRSTGARRALKILRAELLTDAASRERFAQEARISSQIGSHHVVDVVAAGIDDATGVPWLAMEMLDGEDLGRHLSRVGHLAPPDVAVIVTQIGHALGAAHDRAVIHRDLKPENVFLAQSQLVGMPFVVKVLDFGMATLTRQQSAGQTVGTPTYMAPEQCDARSELSPATDVWALGLLVFRMLVGRSLWRSAEQSQVALSGLWRELLLDPIPAASVRAAEYGRAERIPSGVDRWLSRCLDRDPRARFGDARQAAAMLAQLLGRPETGHGLASSNILSGIEPAPGAAGPITGVEPTLQSHASPWDQLAEGSDALGAAIQVTYHERGQRMMVGARSGMSILDISHFGRIPHIDVCGGRAKCTTCRVRVIAGAENLSKRGEAETAVAERKRWPDDLRLACQARVTGPVTVRRLVLDDADRRLVKRELSQPGDAEALTTCILAVAVLGMSDFAAAALPYDTVHVVNRVLAELGEPITQNHGRVVGCSGADMTAIFGQGSAEDATRALRCALRLRARLDMLNRYLLKHFGLALRLSTGLHVGEAVIGDIGYPRPSTGQAFGRGIAMAQRTVRAAAERELRVVASTDFCRVAGPILATGQTLSAADTPGGELIEIHDFVVPDTVYLVQSTFERVAKSSDDFARAFYDHLFEHHRDIEPLFENTDMEVQRVMLMQAIEAVVRGFADPEQIRAPVRELGARHAGYGAQLVHYGAVGEALLATLERFFGDDFTPELRAAWVETYGVVARIMVEGHPEPAP
ncbi:MAG: protein kinase, partial [Myxococcota bacterium]